MASSVSSATQAPVAPAAPVQASPTSPGGRQAPEVSAPRLPTDTVTISSAAAALQEAAETPAQTAREAAAGDLQARRLVARQAAAKTEQEHTEPKRTPA